jgi:hypothetical protein
MFVKETSLKSHLRLHEEEENFSDYQDHLHDEEVKKKES